MAKQAPPGIEGFVELPTLSHAEVDRLCEGCGYNLVGQPIRRDPRTALLVMCCPECGRYSSANDASSAMRTWLRRLLMAPAAARALVLLYLWLCAGWAVGTASFAGLWELTDYVRGGRHRRFYGRIAPDFDTQDKLLLAVMLGAAGAIGMVWAMAHVALLPHWRRLAVITFNMVWPAVAVGLGWWAFVADVGEEHAGWSWPIALCTLLAVQVGTLLGRPLGRPAARGLLRVLLPARVRALFSYLWLVDGKSPPTAKGRKESGRMGTVRNQTPSPPSE